MANNSKTPSSPASGQPSDTEDPRFQVAIRILYYGFVVLSVLTFVALLMIGLPVIFNYSNATATTAYQSIKDLFAIVLPLIGTWVGTVLAFYFGQKNYEAATKGSIELHKQFTSEEKLQATKVTDKEVMIPMDEVSAKLTIPSDKSEKDYLLTELIKILETADKTPRERLPILDAQGAIKYVAHRSLIDKFRGAKIGSAGVTPEALANLTLKDMVDDPVYSKTLTAFVVLPSTANLAEAKRQIDSVPECSDVFVTEDGRRESKVLGWVTNVNIEKCAQITESA